MVANAIVTKRLLMLQMAVEDAVAMVEGRHPNGRPWAPGYPDDRAIMAAGFVVTAVERGSEFGDFGTYQIIRREDGSVIGACGFMGAPDDTGAVRIGYGLAESARGEGYAAEALRGLLDWARCQDGLTCVLADTTRSNIPSQKVMERAGMKRVGEDGELLYYMA